MPVTLTYLANSAPSAVSVAGTSAVLVVAVVLGLGLVAGGVVVALVILRRRVSKKYEAQEDDIEVDKNICSRVPQDAYFFVLMPNLYGSLEENTYRHKCIVFSLITTKLNCQQSCEPIADGEVVEVMQDGEEVAETIPIGQQVVKSESEFTSI